MRPITTEESEELYECFDCGQRYRSVAGRNCEECGGSLNNIGRSRDL